MEWSQSLVVHDGSTHHPPAMIPIEPDFCIIFSVVILSGIHLDLSILRTASGLILNLSESIVREN